MEKIIDRLFLLLASTLFTIAVLTTLAILDKAHAKGVYPPGPIANWFQSQHNANGGWCCDQADGHLFYGDYKINNDGSVDVTDNDGKSYHITKDMVLTGPNPTGAAVWWYLQYAKAGPKYTYCFAIGAQG